MKCPPAEGGREEAFPLIPAWPQQGKDASGEMSGGHGAEDGVTWCQGHTC